jgi:hypothetical protein
VGGSPTARDELGKARREQGRPAPGDAFGLADVATRSLRLGTARYAAAGFELALRSSET